MTKTYQSFSATAIGFEHSKVGKECQDYSLHYDDGEMSLAVVADGHGSEDAFRSAQGAENAARYASTAIKEFIRLFSQPEGVKTNDKPEESDVLASLAEYLPKKATALPEKAKMNELLRGLIKHIVAAWHGMVEKDYTEHPFQEAELANVSEKYRQRYAAGDALYKAYGTTLIATAITEKFWFGFHIGDGRFTALYPDGHFAQPVPWDKKCFLNQTTSICDDDAVKDARFCFAANTDTEKIPIAVFLCSDGVDDNYPVDENEQHLYKLFRTVALTFAEDEFESTAKQIEDLAKSFAEKGKGDDTSIAGIVSMDALKSAASVLKEKANG